MIATFFIYEGVQFVVVELSEYRYRKRRHEEKWSRYQWLINQPWWRGYYVSQFGQEEARSKGVFFWATIVTVVILALELALVLSM